MVSSAPAALKEIEGLSNTTERSLEASVSRISALLNAGKLQSAKNEIDRLQQIYPDATEISALRKRWQALHAKQIQEQTRKEEDQQKAIVRQKEDVWNRQLTEFLARGKYGEAAGALSLWLTAGAPGSGATCQTPGDPAAPQSLLRRNG
jgi:hypothetical protein